MREPAQQVPLFSAARPHERLRHEHVTAARLAEALGPAVQFGTDGWAHPEWLGEVWSAPQTRDQLLAHGLGEYAAHPLLSALLWTVPDGGIELLRDVRLVAAGAAHGLSVYARLPATYMRPRLRAPGRQNPSFLDGKALRREVLTPVREALGVALAGVILSFPPELWRGGYAPSVFADRLDLALAALGCEVPVLVELSERSYLCLEYARVLAAHGASHVLSSAPGMPELRAQACATPTGPLLAVHAVGRPDAAEVAQVVRLVEGQAAVVLVDPQVAGGAPGFIRALAQRLCELPS